jgi:hypothetical protein
MIGIYQELCIGRIRLLMRCHRLSRLERIVQDVVARLDALVPTENVEVARSNAGNSLLSPIPSNVQNNEIGESGSASALGSVAETPGSVASVAPVLVLRDVAKEVGTGRQDTDYVNTADKNLVFDLIDDQILTLEEVTSLLTM